MSSEVTVSGPFFSGPLQTAVLSDIIDDSQTAVTAAVMEAVHFNLDGSIKHPTPYYETQITVQHQAFYDVVHDRGIVYGPWLEGTSRRNATTRFKGYHSFRRAAQTVQGLAPGIVARIVARQIRRLT